MSEIEAVIEAAVAETDPELPEPLYVAAELVTVVGLTYRQVDYWTSTGLLQTKGEVHPGHGSRRGYPESELHKAIALKALLAAGLKLEHLREHIDQFLPTEEGPGSLTVGPVTITYIPEEDTL